MQAPASIYSPGRRGDGVGSVRHHLRRTVNTHCDCPEDPNPIDDDDYATRGQMQLATPTIGTTACVNTYEASAYLNRADVRKALHVDAAGVKTGWCAVAPRAGSTRPRARICQEIHIQTQTSGRCHLWRLGCVCPLSLTAPTLCDGGAAISVSVASRRVRGNSVEFTLLTCAVDGLPNHAGVGGSTRTALTSR